MPGFFGGASASGVSVWRLSAVARAVGRPGPEVPLGRAFLGFELTLASASGQSAHDVCSPMIDFSPCTLDPAFLNHFRGATNPAKVEQT